MTSQGQRFRRRALRRGYKVDEVDAFLDRVDATLAGDGIDATVTAQEVHDVVFRVRFGGYDEWQVDLHLDRVERQLAELEERGTQPRIDPRASASERPSYADRAPVPERPPVGRVAASSATAASVPTPGSPVPSAMKGAMPARSNAAAQAGREAAYGRYDEGAFPAQEDAYGTGRRARADMTAEIRMGDGAFESEDTGPVIPPSAMGQVGHAPVSPGPGRFAQPTAPPPQPPRVASAPAQPPRSASAPTRPATAMGSVAPHPSPPTRQPMNSSPGRMPIEPAGAMPTREPMPAERAPAPAIGPNPNGGLPPASAMAGMALSPDAQRLDQMRRTFQLRRFGSGYDRAQVDRLFDDLLGGLSGRGALPGDADLVSGRFELVPGGYFEADVDAALKEARDIVSRRR